MNNTHCKVSIESSLGKRKCDSLIHHISEYQLHACNLSITFCPNITPRGLLDNTFYKGVFANVWLHDAEGRQLGMVIPTTSLLEIHKALTQALENQKGLEAKHGNN